MSWSISIPAEPNTTVPLNDAAGAIDRATNEPEHLANMMAPDSILKQVKAAKKLAKDAIHGAKECGYAEVQIFLSGHANENGTGDSFGVTIYRK